MSEKSSTFAPENENQRVNRTRIMKSNTKNKPNKWLSENFRLAYIFIAIIASILLLSRPVFSFQQDKGIIYTRHFEMDRNAVTVIQTGLEDHIDYVQDTLSVKALTVLGHLMLWSSVLTLLLFFSPFWQRLVAFLPILFAGIYYLFAVYYAVDIIDRFFATMYPSWPIVMPAIIIEMMVLVRKGIDKEQLESIDGESVD